MVRSARREKLCRRREAVDPVPDAQEDRDPDDRRTRAGRECAHSAALRALPHSALLVPARESHGRTWKISDLVPGTGHTVPSPTAHEFSNRDRMMHWRKAT